MFHYSDILFLWDYTDPRGSFYQYDGLDQVALSVLRPPCPLPRSHPAEHARTPARTPIVVIHSPAAGNASQAIIHAALVRPRAGVFAADATPQWLLLLSTPLEVCIQRTIPFEPQRPPPCHSLARAGAHTHTRHGRAYVCMPPLLSTPPAGPPGGGACSLLHGCPWP